jgi:glycosyltransferase involved in cell wall biosynthesis
VAPTVSVVVATYNFERFLGRAIDSVLAQDYPAEAIEIIVVDDGSTDGTPELMQAYEDRVSYIRKENGGHLSTFDRGIGEATGDYIALLDGDDEWLPHKLREQVALLEANPDLGLVHGDMRVVDDEGRVLAESFFAERNIQNVEGDLLWALMRHNTITTSAVLVRASLRERFHPIPAWARVQDWWISLRVAEVAGIGCLHEAIVDYRRHGSNLNHGRQGRRRAELLRAELPLRRWLLTGTAVEKLGGRDAAAALTALERAADGAAEALDTTRRELLPADREAGEARLDAGLASEDLDAATRHFVAALAHDPWNAIARRELVAAGRRGGWVAAPGATTSAPATAPAKPRIDGARAFVTLADAAELAAQPELLAAYARTFTADDDATLVIRLGSDPAELERLAVAVADAGLEADDAADLLAVPGEGPGALSLAALAPSVDAVLSAALPEGPLAALPCADETGVDALASLARGDGPAWCINICAPNWWTARSWGDLHFARALQQELARRGRPCAIHVIEQWDRSRDERFGVVVHLKGLTTYEPNPAQVNLLWNISHPEKLTVEECEASDVVLVASERFAADLRERVSAPVHVLEQATDPAVFFPEADAAHARDLVFVGNSRKVMRRVLADLLPTDHDLAVWGGDWDGLIDAEHVVGTYLRNDEVRRAYSSAAIVLNDHWDDMREHGFTSNRLYDAVACGALVVSDRIDGLGERFGGAVVTYETREELADIVEHFLAHPEERAARGTAGREMVLAHHTFAHRVDALVAHADAAFAAA